MAVQRLRRRVRRRRAGSTPRPRGRAGTSGRDRAVGRNEGDALGRRRRRGAPAWPGPPYDALVQVAAEAAAGARRDAAESRAASSRSSSAISAATRPRWSSASPAARKETFLQVARDAAGRTRARTARRPSPTRWPGPSTPTAPQIIGCAALLQLLLGNFGRPGGGIMALRGHASIQGSPTCRRSTTRSTATCRRPPRSRSTTRSTTTWSPRRCPPATGPTCRSSSCRTSSRCTATPPRAENDFGYDWHPKILGDHSHLPMFVAMNDGKVKGMLCIGQNPATSLNARLERAAHAQARVAGRQGQLAARDRDVLEDRARGGRTAR